MENKIIEIWKEVIYLAAKYSNCTEEEKKKLVKKFNEYKKDLSQDTSKYSDTIGNFLIDLESDLKAGRKLQIDSIEHDNYLENYFIAQREINHYNLLINEEIYQDIFNEINWNKNPDIILEKIKLLDDNFSKEILLISPEKISKNLLIFTLFEKKLVSKALKNLYNFLITLHNSSESIELIETMIQKHNNIIQKIYHFWVENYNSETYNVYYMKFETEIIKWEKSKNLKKYNSAQMFFRTWNAKYEYKKLLKKIIEF